MTSCSCGFDNGECGCVILSAHKRAMDEYGETFQRLATASGQPAPTGNGTPVTELVIADLQERSRVGTIRYGTPLRAHNGRDALIDAYQEALDLCQYLRQLIEERKTVK